jgi:hypothetical protein
MNFTIQKSVIKQPRDEKGRFLSWDGTKNRKFTLDELRSAFIAGANASSGFQYKTPSQKADAWIKLNGYDK